MNKLLELHHISKKFKDKRALSDVSLSLEADEVVALIGPNGSGKTTLLNILAGIIKPSEGGVSLDRSQTSFYLSNQGLSDKMTVFNNLRMFTTLLKKNDSAALDILEDFKIEFPDKRYGDLSSGMKQKVALATAFLKDFDVLILDEPTNNLDVDTINLLKQKVAEQKDAGKAVLITSHQLKDLFEMCDRFIFLKEGKILLDTSKAKLVEEYENVDTAYNRIMNHE